MAAEANGTRENFERAGPNVVTENIDSSIKINKLADRKKLTCPKCSKSTIKLERHLRDIHKYSYVKARAKPQGLADYRFRGQNPQNPTESITKKYK